ncbi:unnamed protein product, partial [Rotaria sordida]
MSTDMKQLNSSSIKNVHCNVTCLLDLPNEVLLLICRYMSSYHILYSFYTHSTPEMRLHRVIYDYYIKIKVDSITNNEYIYLFSHPKTSLRPEPLIL